jgi:hypothetical protein
MSTIELIEILIDNPPGKLTFLTLYELKKRGSEAVEAVPHIISAFKDCFSVLMGHISGYVRIQDAALEALISMDKQYKLVPVIVSLINNPPFDYNHFDDRPWWIEHFTWIWIGYLGRIGSSAKGAIPLLETIANDLKYPASNRVRKAARKSLAKISP